MVDSKLTTFNKLLIKKAPLLKCIFTTLILQIIVTTVIVYMNHRNPYLVNKIVNINRFALFFLFLSSSIGIMLYMTMAEMPFAQRAVLFGAFSMIQGLLLSLITTRTSKKVVFNALISTFTIFMFFMLVGFVIVYNRIDLSWLGIYLLLTLLMVIIYRISSLFFQRNEKREKYVSLFVIFLFSLFILYDTNNIMLRYENTGVDCIRGSLDYYLDLLNIFANSMRLNR